MRDALERIYWKLEKMLTPGLRHSQQMYEAALSPRVAPGADWLDVGCGHQVLPEWRAQQEIELAARCRRLVGLDGDAASLVKHRTIRCRVAGDISALPFPSGSFDLVTANMVVEHLREPERQFAEISRVLRPGGVFLFLTPSARTYSVRMARLVPRAAKRRVVQLLEGRADEDVYDTFYRANTGPQIERLAQATGMAAEEIRMVATSAVFSIVPPLAFVELLYIRFLLSDAGRAHRQDIIAVLRKR